jgi:hypothetical protein
MPSGLEDQKTLTAYDFSAQVLSPDTHRKYLFDVD